MIPSTGMGKQKFNFDYTARPYDIYVTMIIKTSLEFFGSESSSRRLITYLQGCCCMTIPG